MSDLISRQATINAIANTCFWLSADNWEELIKCINSIPPVENSGEWIELPRAFNPSENPCECSKCGHILSFMNGYPKSNFCPNCGGGHENIK